MELSQIEDQALDQAQLDHLMVKLCERDFYSFVKEVWSQIESVEFVDNWHLQMLCDHLQAIDEGILRDLIVNVPPACSKSLITSVLWPVWRWIRDPSLKFMCVSYSEALAIQHSNCSRELIQSAWFKARWGDKVVLSKKQNQKKYYETTAGGYRLSTTTPGGRATGQHPDVILVDDPHNVEMAESEAERKAVIEWWDLTMSTRGVTRPNRKRVIIMQRLHEDDLSGHILSKDEGVDRWCHVCLPMRFENDRMPQTPVANSTTGEPWQDPRTEDGELLWKSMFDEETLTEIEDDLTEYGVAGQLQQRPAPRDGGMFQLVDFQLLEGDAFPDVFDKIVRFWDRAATDGGGDWTVGILMGRVGYDYYVIDEIRGRWRSSKVEDFMDIAATLDNTEFDGAVVPWFEEGLGDAGKKEAEITKANLAHHGLRGERPIGTKPDRARSYSTAAQNGHVYVNKQLGTDPKAARRFIEEHLTFPNGKNDDRIDAASGAFRQLALPKRSLLVGKTAKSSKESKATAK